jgi:hypothetical protein
MHIQTDEMELRHGVSSGLADSTQVISTSTKSQLFGQVAAVTFAHEQLKSAWSWAAVWLWFHGVEKPPPDWGRDCDYNHVWDRCSSR